MRLLLSGRQSYEVEHIRIGNHFVPTRAAASLSNLRNQGWMTARKVSAFVMAGQGRLTHTWDSLSESLKRHLCRRYRPLWARGAAGYDCGRAQVQLVLLVYLDEMVPCAREPPVPVG